MHDILLSVPMLIGGATYMHLESKNKLAAQAGDAQQLIETLIVEKEQTEFYIAEQVETNLQPISSLNWERRYDSITG